MKLFLNLIKVWKLKKKSKLFTHIIYNTSIIEQNRAKTSMAFFERASSSKIFFEQYRVWAFFEQDFFEQFRVRVLSSGQIFERAEQNFEQTAAQSQHYLGGLTYSVPKTLISSLGTLQGVIMEQPTATRIMVLRDSFGSLNSIIELNHIWKVKSGPQSKGFFTAFNLKRGSFQR